MEDEWIDGCIFLPSLRRSSLLRVPPSGHSPQTPQLATKTTTPTKTTQPKPCCCSSTSPWCCSHPILHAPSNEQLRTPQWAASTIKMNRTRPPTTTTTKQYRQIRTASCHSNFTDCDTDNSIASILQMEPSSDDEQTTMPSNINDLAIIDACDSASLSEISTDHRDMIAHV